MNFVCANEDTNLYTFDLRNLNQVRVSVKSATPKIKSRCRCELRYNQSRGDYSSGIAVCPG